MNYRIELDADDGLSFKIGPSAENELRVLGPGETVTTPAAHLGHVKGDFDDAVQAMHAHVRRSVAMPPQRGAEYRIQYLLNEDNPNTICKGDDHTEANVKKCIEVGAELIIEDGPTWAEAFGNWVARADRFPNGLDPVREHAHENGLLFGIYAEPEGGRDDWTHTDAFREHPDWFFDGAHARNCINLAIPKAAAYVEAEWRQVIERHKLDLYRHDYNTFTRGESTSTQRHGFVENDYWRYYDAFYGIVKRLRESYPNMILHQASGSGTRLELETIRRFQEHYTSDRVTTPYVYQMLAGLSVYLPPEVFVNPNGMSAPDGRPDQMTLLRCIYAAGNTPMIFNGVLPASVDELTEDTRQLWVRYAGLFKSFIRPILGTCLVYHHDPVNATGCVESSPWFAMEFISADRQKGWALVIRMWHNAADVYHLTPKGLAAESTYRVMRDNTGTAEVVEGATLMDNGLSIAIPGDTASELVLFEAVGD